MILQLLSLKDWDTAMPQKEHKIVLRVMLRRQHFLVHDDATTGDFFLVHGDATTGTTHWRRVHYHLLLTRWHSATPTTDSSN